MLKKYGVSQHESGRMMKSIQRKNSVYLILACRMGDRGL